MKARMFHLHALSALHSGIGQAAGVIDLPIARARATNIPIIPGSSLKGVLRDEFHDKASQTILFGPESISNNEQAHAGALAFGDAHLLLFPVRSLKGVMALITCPFVLKRYRIDLERIGTHDLPQIPDVSGEKACAGKDCLNIDGKKILLEDLDLNVDENPGAEKWANLISSRVHGNHVDFQQEIARRFVIVSDDVFSFMVDTATEVRTRIRIDDERGVVTKGALWYEENLPAESILWGMIGMGRGRNAKGGETRDAAAVESIWLERVKQISTIRLGGKVTVGRGLVRFVD